MTITEISQPSDPSESSRPEIPAGWSVPRVSELVKKPSFVTYGVLKPGPRLDDGVAMLRVKDLINGHIDTSDLYGISPELDAEYKRTKLGGGEVLISIQGTVGKGEN